MIPTKKGTRALNGTASVVQPRGKVKSLTRLFDYFANIELLDTDADAIAESFCSFGVAGLDLLVCGKT